MPDGLQHTVCNTKLLSAVINSENIEIMSLCFSSPSKQIQLLESL